MPTAAAAGAAPVLAASSLAAAQSVYMPTAAAAVVAAHVLNAAADLDILVDIGIGYNLDDVSILIKSSSFLGFAVTLPPNKFDLIQTANFVVHQPRMFAILVCMPALGILDLGIDDILGPDILVEMPTFDILADVLADFPSLDMPALDILVYLPTLDILGPEVEDILTGLPLADILDLSACILVYMPVLDILDYHLLCTLPLCICPLCTHPYHPRIHPPTQC